MIEFTEVSTGGSHGTVELKGGKLITRGYLSSRVQAWLRQGKTPAEFMEYYSDWSNGYVMSKTVEGTGGSGAAEEDEPEKRNVRTRTFATKGEDLTPVGAVEQLLEIIYADVEAHPEMGFVCEEIKYEADKYLEWIKEADSEEDVRKIIESLLEEIPVSDYEGAEYLEEYFKSLLDSGAPGQ